MERAGARRVHIGGDRGHSALMLWILYCQGLVIIAFPALRFPMTRALDCHVLCHPAAIIATAAAQDQMLGILRSLTFTSYPPLGRQRGLKGTLSDCVVTTTV